MKKLLFILMTMLFLHLPSANAQVGKGSDLYSKLAANHYKIKYSSDGLVGIEETTTGKTIVYPWYDKIVDYDMRYKVFTVMKDGLYGIVDTDDKAVVPTKYKSIGKFSEGIVVVDAEEGLGFVDFRGNIIVPCKYQSVGTYFSEGMVFVKEGDLWGIVNSQGEMVAQPKYEECGRFKGGVALVKRNGKYGFVDKSGNEIIAPQYEKGMSFSEGLAPVMKNGKWGFINKQDQNIIPFEYDAVAVNGFWNGRTFLWKNGKAGLFSSSGKTLIPPIYDIVYPFHDDRAAVVDNGKLGFVDKTGKLVIPCIYDTRSDERLGKSDETYRSIDDEYKFFGNVAYVKYKGKYQLIDKFGHTVSNKQYDTSSPYWSMNLVIKTRRGKDIVYVDLQGKEFAIKRQAQLSSWKYLTSRMDDFEAETQCMIGSYFYYGKENINQTKDARQASVWLNAAKKKGIKGVGYKGYGRYEYDIAYMLSKCRYEIKEDEQPAEPPTLDWLSGTGDVTSDTYVLRVGVKTKSAIKDKQIFVNGQRILKRGINRVQCDGYQQIIEEELTLAAGENKVEVMVRNKAGEDYQCKTIFCKPSKNIDKPTPHPVVQEVNSQRRVALVIGNQKYKEYSPWPDLGTTINDAEAVVAKLRNMGYEVDFLYNATWNATDSILCVFEQKAADSDAAIFYYAGHGISDTYGANYMVPVSATSLDIEQCVKMYWVLEHIKDSKLRVLLLDNCRTKNPKVQKGSNIQLNYQSMNYTDYPNTFIMYSTSALEEASDGNDIHSPFAEAVLSAWDEADKGIGSFQQHVTSQVYKTTNKKQLAWGNGAILCDFKF